MVLDLEPMHVMFVHQTSPGQFEHLARYLVGQGHRCTFVSEESRETPSGVTAIEYQPSTQRPRGFLTQDVEEEVSHAAAVFEALKPVRHSISPDVIVGHAGWGSTLFLPELYPGVPIVDYFEYFHHPHDSAIDFRPDFPPDEQTVMRHRVQNSSLMLHLEYCSAGITPTRFQHELLPAVYRPKVRVLHDGIDTGFWRRDPQVGSPPGDLRIVTYVARGLESMRGFDIFMRAAKLIYQQYPAVVFFVVGWDTVSYGSDMRFTGGKSFKEFVLSQDEYDLEKIRFLGPVSRESLARLLALSDLHIYLTVPFVLSWSVLQAMSCGCTVLASDTAPVREVIKHGHNGLLHDFFDAEGLATAAVDVLKDRDAHRDLGLAARRTIEQQYAVEVVVPQTVSFLREFVNHDPDGIL
jgi:glycosyltransferase involved in cell wall biosynthesis